MIDSVRSDHAPGQAPKTEVSPLSLSGWSDLLSPAALVALAWSLTQIAIVIWPSIGTLAQRALHVGFSLSLAFMIFGRLSRSRTSFIGYTAFGVLAFLPALYIVLQVGYLTSKRIQGLDPVRPLDYAVGLLMIGSLLVAGERVLGLGLLVFTALFVAYFFAGPYLPGALAHRYSSLEQFIDSQYLSLHGIFGDAVGVSNSTVFYFILFAAIYDAYGGGRVIIDMSFALTGRAAGGPAKAAIVASGFMGTISGSAVANVMSVGIFTIPLMLRTGYSARFAVAIEAAAFIMADYLQTPYQTIALAAVIPAALYYAALMLLVDLQARSQRLRVIEVTTTAFSAGFLARWHLLLPLIWLVYRTISGFPVENAAVEGCAVTILIGSLRAATRQAPLALVDALVVAAERTIAVALPCALAGIVVAVCTFSPGSARNSPG